MAKVKSPIEQIDKEREVIALRRAGYTFDDIARRLNYAHPSGAYTAYQRALKRTLVEAGTEELRATELDRLDRLQAAVWDEAMTGNPTAIQTALKILDRRAKYLGLDAPIKQEIKMDIADAASIDAEVARLVELLATNDKQRN
jgi:hypothetical protein